MQVIDLTRTIETGMPVYPGDPACEITVCADYAPNGYLVSRFAAGMHSGTHIDGPSHMLKGKPPLSSFPAGRFLGRGVLINARGRKITADLLDGRKLRKGDIVLVLTGFSKHSGRPEFFLKYPPVEACFAGALVKAGVSMMGIDTPSIDYKPYKSHKILMKEDILICENLVNLDKLSGCKKFEVIALPAKFKAEAAPARVVALLP